jgi:magnesium-transporting ATPase (P-type)
VEERFKLGRKSTTKAKGPSHHHYHYQIKNPGHTHTQLEVMMVSFSRLLLFLILWTGEGGTSTVSLVSVCDAVLAPSSSPKSQRHYHQRSHGVLVASMVVASTTCSIHPSRHRRSAYNGQFRMKKGRSFVLHLRGGGSEEIPGPEEHPAPLALIEDPGSLEISTLLQELHTNPTFGLTETQVHDRLRIFGKNELAKPPQQSIWSLIAEQFQDRLVQILVVVAVISAIFSALEHTSDHSLLKSFVEPIVIVSILVLNAAVGVIQSQSAQDSLQALQDMQPTLCTPIRGGVVQANTPAANLVPGDIIQLRVGDKIPADARIVELQSSTLQVEESSLTGEAVTVAKLSGKDGISEPGAPLQAQGGMVFAGTMVTAGNAIAVCTSTGMETQFGKIQQGVTEAQQEPQKTPLAIKLDEFGDQLTVIIGIICVAVWLVSIPKMSGASFANQWDGAIYYAKVAVALGVAAIPEGLPAVITLCLSLGTRRMAQRNVIVRRLPSVETLGCTSVICTDKTGTLTTNEMTVVSLVILEGNHEVIERTVEGISYSPIGKVEGVDSQTEFDQHPKGALVDVGAVAALCNDASIIGNDDVKDGKSSGSSKIAVVERIYERTGEPTEAALCVLAEKLGGKANRSGEDLLPGALASANVDAWRINHPRKATLEFNRDRKSELRVWNPRNRNDT